MRLVTSPAVIASAEGAMLHISAAYLAPNLTLRELIDAATGASQHILYDFGIVCRRELESVD